MATRVIQNSSAWGGSWGLSWAGSWDAAWTAGDVGHVTWRARFVVFVGADADGVRVQP